MVLNPQNSKFEARKQVIKFILLLASEYPSEARELWNFEHSSLWTNWGRTSRPQFDTQPLNQLELAIRLRSAPNKVLYCSKERKA